MYFRLPYPKYNMQVVGAEHQFIGLQLLQYLSWFYSCLEISDCL